MKTAYRNSKKGLVRTLTSLMSVFLLQLIISCGATTDTGTGNGDQNPATTPETISARPGFRAITGLVGTTDTAAANGFGLVEDTQASSCDVFCWLLEVDDSSAEGETIALAEGEEVPAEDNLDVTGQAACYCNEETNEYYCDIPTGAVFECGLAPQGIPNCAFNYEVPLEDVGEGLALLEDVEVAVTPVMEMGTDGDGSNGDVVHKEINCVDGTAAVEGEGNSFRTASSRDFLSALETGLPDAEVVDALAYGLGYEGHFISVYDQTREDRQGGCYTEHCGRDYNTGLGLTEENFDEYAADGYSQGGGEEYYNDGPPPEAFDHGGQFFDNRIGDFNPIVCPKAGYTISDFFFEAAAGKHGGDDFEKSGAHFQFEFVDEEACDIETATDDSTCLINVTVTVEGDNGDEEQHEFLNVPFTGVKNNFIIQGEENLSDTEIKELALREWGRDFLSQREEFFIPMELPYPDNFCEPVNLVNGVRQYFGYDALDESTDEAYATVFPGSQWGSNYGYDPFREEGELCSEKEEDQGGEAQESSLLTLEELCTDPDEGDIRSKTDLLEAYPAFFSSEEEVDAEAETFACADTDFTGICDNWNHFDQASGDYDNDGIINLLDFYTDDDTNEGKTDAEVIALAYSVALSDGDNDWSFWYKWDLQQIHEHINSGNAESKSDLYTAREENEYTYTFTDSDEDGVIDLVDSCLDGTGYFDPYTNGKDNLTCVPNKASGYLKDVALLHADAICQAYDAKERRDFWSFKANKEIGEGTTGWCRPHGEDSEMLGTCSTATSQNTCEEGTGWNCWWDSDYAFDESMTVLRLVGLELNAGLWSDDWSITEMFDPDGDVSYEWPDDIFQPWNWWSINMDEADEAIADAQKADQEWKNEELEMIHRDISDCRDRFGGNKKDLTRRSTHIAGILASVERLNELVDSEGNKTRICTQPEGTFDEEACLAEKDLYDINNNVECPQGKMTECQFTNLQAILLKAKKRIKEWSDAQAAIDATYKYIEDAVETSSEDECLDDTLVHVDSEEAEEGTVTLADQLSAFASAYTTDIKKAQLQSFNHLRCMEMDKNLATAKESCMVAPSYGKKSAYSTAVIDDLFLANENGECKDGEYMNALGECEEEIICPMPPNLTNALRTQCIDDVVNQAVIVGDCGSDFITEKFAFIGNLALDTSWNDGEPINKDDMVTKLVRMTSHVDGVNELLNCKIELKVPQYDENGCWIYESTIDGDTVLTSDLQDSCYDENNELIEGCIARSDEDVQAATWKRKTVTTTIDMRNIAERQIIKMKLKKASAEDDAQKFLEDFERLKDAAASEFNTGG